MTTQSSTRGVKLARKMAARNANPTLVADLQRARARIQYPATMFHENPVENYHYGVQANARADEYNKLAKELYGADAILIAPPCDLSLAASADIEEEEVMEVAEVPQPVTQRVPQQHVETSIPPPREIRSPTTLSLPPRAELKIPVDIDEQPIEGVVAVVISEIFAPVVNGQAKVLVTNNAREVRRITTDTVIGKLCYIPIMSS